MRKRFSFISAMPIDVEYVGTFNRDALDSQRLNKMIDLQLKEKVIETIATLKHMLPSADGDLITEFIITAKV